MKRILPSIVTLISCLLTVFLVSVLMYAFTPGPDHEGKKEVSIPEGAGLFGIRRILADNQIIHDDIRFAFLAKMMDSAHRLKAGEYDFDGKAVPYLVLRDLERGSIRYRSLTIPEGVTIGQIAKLMEESGIVERDVFLSFMNDPALIDSVGLDVDSLEGYLFPDTYRFTKGTAPEMIIHKMVERFKDVYDGLSAGHETATPLSRHQVITLASIVEKESAHEPERPLIARVFLNRLEQNMPLQADPTVIYGIPGFDGNLKKQDLQTHTPYNTYMVKGLPPGPIGNPGRTAIAAVLMPAQGDFLYFVSKNDGTHHFSKTLTEHNSAVKTYQK